MKTGRTIIYVFGMLLFFTARTASADMILDWSFSLNYDKQVTKDARFGLQHGNPSVYMMLLATPDQNAAIRNTIQGGGTNPLEFPSIGYTSPNTFSYAHFFNFLQNSDFCVDSGALPARNGSQIEVSGTTTLPADYLNTDYTMTFLSFDPSHVGESGYVTLHYMVPDTDANIDAIRAGSFSYTNTIIAMGSLAYVASAPIPEPATAGLVMLGLATILMRRRVRDTAKNH